MPDVGGLVVDARERGLAGDGVTNDQPALAALVNELGRACARDGLRRAIRCPAGVYLIRGAGTVWRSGVSLLGDGPGLTRFVLSNEGSPGVPVPLAYFTALQHGASREHHVADCTFAGFEIDGSRVELDRYDPLAKGLGLQYVLRGRFRDLYVHHTAATGLGCDFLQDTIVSGVLAEGCGRLDTGQQMGGAGIGIGIGGWGASERLVISACAAVGNGTNGIFLELQQADWVRPRGITITGCHASDNRLGISDWGAEGLVVTGCTMTGNHIAGFDVSGHGTSQVAGRGGLVTGCLIDGNVREGVVIGDTPGPYAIRGNRISDNGGHGYRHYDFVHRGSPAEAIVVEDNDVFGNALDGIHVAARMNDGFITGNRVRDNGGRGEPAASGTVGRCTETSLRDPAANWRTDGHRGKTVTVGAQDAIVTGNSADELALAPYRPGATTAWRHGTPPAGEQYTLSAAPPVRGGVVLKSTLADLTLRGNRVWDAKGGQTHALYVIDECDPGDLSGNDLRGPVRA
ncbi:right-handed parallel beta-helix repeat-containing protein [Bailinhaonella thermotolerans]|uniref:Right-handed parallel beta-helix repeat-containing protein n=1 Tax=Bailinhaonella thermotolerans TaxID=1070861 RepID=A0A3A4AWN2_9ACTN|nr:right-handed parallel beta-helix repeat-containing protein [Bailinhaonella thermotolerans]RJL34345.1 right-handed parallel beta-helix repeat-containing protein [Bailinhaonella thermotolerans]